MKRLITFLGTGNYQETTYTLEGRQYHAATAIEALQQWHNYEQIDCFLTDEARQHSNWATLERKIKCQPHAIPDGRNDAELWDIFRIVCDGVTPGDIVSLDVTHGLRSFGIFAMSIAQFLTHAKQVQLDGLYYGAFEVRDKDKGITPIFDLSAQLKLMQWTAAEAEFRRTGNPAELGKRLAETHQQAWSGKREDPEGPAPPRRLNNAGNHLQRVGNAYQLGRPFAFHDEACGVEHTLGQALADEVCLWAVPFQQVLGEIRDAFANFARERSLPAQRSLIQRYCEHGQVIQAVTLAREWLISYAADKLGCAWVATPPFDGREDFETFFTSYVATFLPGGKQPKSPSFNDLTLADCDEIGPEIAKLFDQLSNLRNDLNHAGFRCNPMTADHILRRAIQLCQRLPETTASSSENP